LTEYDSLKLYAQVICSHSGEYEIQCSGKKMEVADLCEQFASSS